MRLSLPFALVLAALCTAAPVAAQESVEVRTIYAGKDDIAAFDFLAGGDLVIAEQRRGRIMVHRVETGETDVLLDLTAVTKRNPPIEQGVLGVAVSPDYQQSNMVYVVYTDLFNRWTLSRFTGTSEEVLIRADRYAAYHACGTVTFSPVDNYLYACVGDSDVQGSPNANSFNLEIFHGKILRIDVMGQATGYRIPADNPHAYTPGARPEIWISGLRNPWMFSFDPDSGDAYVPDVGFDAAEELNVIPKGAGGKSYGWPAREGFVARPSPFPCEADACSDGEQAEPDFAYLRSNEACAIIGGAVFRADPTSSLYGAYLHGDLCSTELKAVRIGEVTEVATVATLESPPLAIRRGPDGAIYISDWTHSISRIDPATLPAEIEWAPFRSPVAFDLKSQADLVQKLEDSRDKIIVLSVKDEATERLSDATRSAIVKLGFARFADLSYRGSYAGVVSNGVLVDEAVSGDQAVGLQSTELAALGIDSVVSAGFESGNMSFVVVDGMQSSPGQRGINVVIVSPDKVESSSLDTFMLD